MKLEVNIDKRYFIIIVSLILMFGIVLVSNAYGGNQPDVMGHSWDEIDKPADYADDADADPTNEIQNLNQVLDEGNNADGQRIANLGSPTNANDAATKQYVDNNGGSEFSCRVCIRTRNECSGSIDEKCTDWVGPGDSDTSGWSSIHDAVHSGHQDCFSVKFECQ